jgi:hypothetical protein
MENSKEYSTLLRVKERLKFKIGFHPHIVVDEIG